MDTLTTLDTLKALEREMAEARRNAEAEALHKAINALTRRDRRFMTTGQAADALGVSIPTIKRWMERGAVRGVAIGSRWLVLRESVEHLVRLREAMEEIDREGTPTDDDLAELYSRPRSRGRNLRRAAARA